MKKLLLMVLALALVVSAAAGIAVVGSADEASADIQIKKTATAPTLDGTFTEDEWKDAAKMTLNSDNAGFKTAAADASADFYYTWDDAALYVAAVVTDPYIDTNLYKNGVALNTTDGIQVELDPTNSKTNTSSGDYIFDFVPQSEEGGAIWYEHFVIKGNSNDKVSVSAKLTDNGYVIEAKIGWDALRLKDEKFTVAEGTRMGFGNILMDVLTGTTSPQLISDENGAICNPAHFKTLVLVNEYTEGEVPSASDTGSTGSSAAEDGGCGNNAE